MTIRLSCLTTLAWKPLPLLIILRTLLMIVLWIIISLYQIITTFQEYLSHSTVCITLRGGSIVFVHLNSSSALSQLEISLHSRKAMQLFQKHSSSYMELCHLLRDNTLPNCMGSRIRVPSNMNIGAWEDYLRNFYDTQLIDFLKFGFPLDMVTNPTLDNNFVATIHCYSTSCRHSNLHR